VKELLKGSATAMARAVRERKVGPVELVEAQIARIEEVDPDLNAMVLPRFEEALDEARAAERKPLTDPLGALHGVPFTAKECIEVAGMPCCDASKIFEGNVSTEDATVITNLRDEGAILLGKTNIPEFAFHYDSNNLVYGATHNPHDHERSVGGSSGGEAAALAAGMSAFGVGSDYGGSIRVPAHFCGVVGLKPGRWVVPYAGHFPPTTVMTMQLWSVIGPMARFVEDLQMLLPVFARANPARDPDVAPHRVLPQQPQNLRVAAFFDDGVCPVDDTCREAVQMAARALADGGHEVTEERPPNQVEVRDIFVDLALAESVALLAPLVGPREDELSPQIRRIFERAAAGEPDLASYARQLAQRLDLERAACAWIEEHQIAIAPIGAVPAFPIGTETLEIAGQEVEEVDLFAHSTYVNAISLPAVAVPITRTPEGLPVGVQVIGRRYREMEVLAIALELEQAFGGYIDPDAPRVAVTQTG
jgi:amidase